MNIIEAVKAGSKTIRLKSWDEDEYILSSIYKIMI